MRPSLNESVSIDEASESFCRESRPGWLDRRDLELAAGAVLSDRAAANR